MLHLDIETYSAADLKTGGVYRYAEDPSTDLNVVCWAVDDGPVNVWLPWSAVPASILIGLREWPEWDERSRLDAQANCPAELRAALTGEVAAHNAQFERVVLNHTAGRKHAFPALTIEQTVCTMAKCAVHGLPHALEHAAKALGTYPKRAEGVNEMRYCAKPRANGTRPTPAEEPERWLTMTKYCIDDVKAERDLHKHVPDLTESEMRVYRLDQRINERGVLCDLASVDSAMYLTEQYKLRLRAFCQEKTGCSPTQTGKLADWCRANGYHWLPNLQADTVVRALEDPRCPENVREVLKCYSTHNMKAVTKYDAMKRAACADGRLRGMLYFYGANPGRWSSRIVQLQNMLRPLIKDCDAAIDAIGQRSLNWLRWLFAGIDAMKVLASCVRGMLIASPGKDLMAYDFAQIESRLQAWLSDTEWKVEFFHKDSEYKIYHVTGAMMFGVDPSEVVDKGEEQLYTAAKIGELACLAAGTLVLCRRGWVPIERVTADDEVWDGIEWVKQRGPIFKGFRTTLTLCGVRLTPDHLVLSANRWRPAESLAGMSASGRFRLSAPAAANLPLPAIWLALAAGLRDCSSSAIAGGLSTLFIKATTIASTLVDAYRVQTKPALQLAKVTGSTPTQCQTTPIGGDYSTAYTPPSTDATMKAISNTVTTVGVELKFAKNGGPISAHSSSTFKPLKDGISRSCTWIGSTIVAATSRVTSALLRAARTTKIAARLASLKPSVPVYDLRFAGSRNRFTVLGATGPLIVHNCGYQGWEMAIRKFADKMNIQLSMDPAEIAGRWRDANQEQVRTWGYLNDAALAAVRNPGRAYAIPNRKAMFKVEGRWLYMRLPSGRKLAYLDPEIGDEGRGECVTYMGTDTDTRRFMRVSGYGGRWMQNWCEGVGRDLLVAGIFNMEDAGYETILSVHDEGVFEVPKGFGSDEEARELMTKPLPWAKGLPVKCDGWRAQRYRK